MGYAYIAVRNADQAHASEETPALSQAKVDRLPSRLHSDNMSSRVPGTTVQNDVSAAPQATCKDAMLATENDTVPVMILGDCVEASIRGHLDVYSVVDSVLRLTDSDIDTSSVPDIKPTGTYYPLKPQVQGVGKAAFVRKNDAGRKPEAHAFSLFVRLSAPAQPRLIDGAVREPPEAEVSLVFDERNRPIKITVLTTAQVSPKNEALHIQISEMTFVSGLLYSVNLDDMSDRKARWHGFDHMRSKVWDAPISLDGEPWPDLTLIHELEQRLIALSGQAGYPHMEDRK